MCLVCENVQKIIGYKTGIQDIPFESQFIWIAFKTGLQMLNDSNDQVKRVWKDMPSVGRHIKRQF